MWALLTLERLPPSMQTSMAVTPSSPLPHQQGSQPPPAHPAMPTDPQGTTERPCPLLPPAPPASSGGLSACLRLAGSEDKDFFVHESFHVRVCSGCQEGGPRSLYWTFISTGIYSPLIPCVASVLGVSGSDWKKRRFPR